MISDACFDFLQTNDVKTLISQLKYYLNDNTFSTYYPGDIRVRCNWILVNYGNFDIFLNRDPTKDIYILRDQVQQLLTELDTPPES